MTTISLPAYINAAGIEEIREFLAKNHKKPEGFFNASMLRAWAADAENQLSNSNPPTIEISCASSASGHTETYTVSDAGVDFADHEIDE
jgi:hypothetical protein